MKKILGIVIIIAAIIGIWFITQNKGSENDGDTQVELGDPVDTVSDFYGAWLRAAQSTSTDPYAAGVIDDMTLADELRERLRGAQADTVDPVLCQEVPPDSVRTKLVFRTDTESQVLFLPRGEGVITQALVSLSASTDGWEIVAIECVQSETAPDREYSFEREGFLLKNVPEPLDSQYWHLVFEQDGQMGHTVPLFFDGSSTCVAPDSTESVCDPNSFIEAIKVHVGADMSESGATVKRLEFLE